VDSRRQGLQLALQRLLGKLDERLGLLDGDLVLLAAHPPEAVLRLVLEVEETLELVPCVGSPGATCFRRLTASR
jgi:hypothetical protein